MKYLILMRHAHPEYGLNTDDLSRELTSVGVEAASNMASFLSRNDFVPQRMFTSHARRARQTAEIVARQLSVTDVVVCEQIYYGYTTGDMLSVIGETSDELTTLMLVGHNPDINTFASNLTVHHSLSFPPAGVIVVGFDIDKWSDIEPYMGSLLSFNTPRG